MPLLPDCPLCKIIVDKKIEKESDLCYLVSVGNLKVAILKDHTDQILPKAFGEAARLLNFEGNSGAVLKDYDRCSGHWGLQLVQTDIPQGRSGGK